MLPLKLLSQLPRIVPVADSVTTMISGFYNHRLGLRFSEPVKTLRCVVARCRQHPDTIIQYINEPPPCEPDQGETFTRVEEAIP